MPLAPSYGFLARITACCLVLDGLSSLSAPCFAGAPSLAAQRDRLVRSEIIPAGITDLRVVEAIRSTPRHEFVPRVLRERAYFDMALPIGEGQTISPPFVVAMMTQQLDPQPDDRVLEIGTGSGYQAAVLSPLVADVYSIEIVESLGRAASRRLSRLGYRNVHTRVGDGYQGWPEHAPFDKIIVTCSPEDVPQPLVEQLAEGGRMIVPLGERFQQRLYVFEKRDGELQRKALRATFFVPMTGRAERERQIVPDLTQPRLVHGSFETTLSGDAQERLPVGWYYLRQGRVVADATAPDGDNVLAFENDTPGRRAHAMQAFGVDGRAVSSITVQCYFRADRAVAGPTRDQQPGVLVEFYGSSRAPVGQQWIGPMIGTSDWRRAVQRLRVPSEARLAVIGIGLFGATGRIAFDAVEVSGAASLPERWEARP